MFGLSFGEVLVLALIALVLFGKEDLPATLRKFMKGFQEVKKVTSDAQRSWQDVKDDVSRTIMQADLEDEIKKSLAEAEERAKKALVGGTENISQPTIIETTVVENTTVDGQETVLLGLDEGHNPDGTLKQTDVVSPQNISEEIENPVIKIDDKSIPRV